MPDRQRCLYGKAKDVAGDLLLTDPTPAASSRPSRLGPRSYDLTRPASSCIMSFVIKIVQILFAATIATIYAVAAPLHVIADHADLAHSHDGLAVEVEAYSAVDDHDHLHASDAHPGESPTINHGHDPEHDHSIQDHWVVRTRVAGPHFEFAATGVAVAGFVPFQPVYSIPVLEAPPPRTPTLSFTSLRGPPVG